MIRNCSKACWFQWGILLPLTASLQSGETPGCHDRVHWMPTQPGSLSFLRSPLPHSPGHSTYCVGPVQCWGQRPGNHSFHLQRVHCLSRKSRYYWSCFTAVETEAQRAYAFVSPISWISALYINTVFHLALPIVHCHLSRLSYFPSSKNSHRGVFLPFLSLLGSHSTTPS